MSTLTDVNFKSAAKNKLLLIVDNSDIIQERLLALYRDTETSGVFSYEQYRKRFIDRGADHFFVKSDDMNNLAELCEKVNINS